MGEFSTTGAVASVAGGITLASILEYFHLSYEVVSIFAALMILDFAFGLIDQWVKDKQKITSTRMWNGLAKKLSKMMLPLIVVLVLRGIGFENLDMVVTTIMSILVITEGYSVLGHIYCLNTGQELSEIDSFSLLLDYVIGIFKQNLPKKEGNETKTKE